MWLVDASNSINMMAVLDGLRSPFSQKMDGNPVDAHAPTEFRFADAHHRPQVSDLYRYHYMRFLPNRML